MKIEDVLSDFNNYVGEKLDFSKVKKVPTKEGEFTTAMDGNDFKKQLDSNTEKVQAELNRVVKANPDNADEIRKAIIESLPEVYKDKIY